MKGTVWSRNDSTTRRPFLTTLTALLGVLILCTALYAVTVVWTRTVNGADNDIDSAQSLALAPNGDLYAVGYRTDPDEYRNIWIRKFSSNGSTKWTRVVDGSASTADMAHDVAVDGDGNLYVVGYTNPSGGIISIWIRKYTSSGAKLWTRTVAGQSGTAVANGAAVDASGNLYVVGYTFTSTGQEDIWIRKYNSAGAKQWTRTVAGVGAGSDYARGAAVDSAGNLYVVGQIYSGSAESNNIWIRKFSPTGAKLWTRTVNGPSDGSDAAHDVAVDSADNLYVVGHVSVFGESLNIWIRKYSPTGSKKWTRTVNGPGDNTDQANAVAIDGNDAVYIAGYQTLAARNLASGPRILWMRKYSSAGVKRWTHTKTGPDGELVGNGITVNSTKRVYVAGKIFKTGESLNIWVRKYAQ